MTMLLLVAAAVVATLLAMYWLRSPLRRAPPSTPEEQEIGRAKAIGAQLKGERDRTTKAAAESNKAALAKAVKAALWVTESRLNFAIPELLETAQLWHEWLKLEKWRAPTGLTEIEGQQDPKSPWAAWRWNDQHWRIEGEWDPANLPDDLGEDNGRYRVYVDQGLMLDMRISSADLHVMWIDALTVGPWVSELIEFAGERKADSQAISDASFARQYQDRADKIHW